jgi:carbon monoxide dehydrogenase subunit G
MNISGTATLHAPVDAVYAALTDPAVLVATIPGCQRLEQSGVDAYTMVVTAGVAAVKGTYRGDVALIDRQPPHAFVLKASGAGAPGTVSAEANVRLDDAGDGTTTLTYDADAVVGGMVGGVGQRVLSGVARKTANEFFAAVDRTLTGAGGEPLAAGSAVPGPAGAAGSGLSPDLTGSAAPAGAATSAGPVAAGVDGATVPVVYTRPAGADGRAGAAAVFPGGDVAVGAVIGAGAALAGVLVGAIVARRPRRSPRS